MTARYADPDEDADLIDSFAQWIQERLGDWYGSSAFLKSPTPQIRCYTNSFLLRYEVMTSTGNRGILLKIRRNPKMTSLRRAVESPDLHINIPKEYNTLCYVYERIGSGHEHFTAIRPLGYFEDYFAILMEEFPSHSLRHLLQKQRHNNRVEVQVIAQRAGELLRFFHERVYSTAPAAYSADDILADAETFARRLEQHSRGRVRMQGILDAFARKLSKKDIHSIPYTTAHQDLTCDNVLYSEAGKVCLIDINVKPAPIYSDLGLLLIHPEAFRDQIFRDGRYFSQQYLKNYRDSILKGYSVGSPINHFLVNVYSAIRVLDKWAMHQELFYNYKGWKRIITLPLAPLVTSYFQRLWKYHLQTAV